MAKLSVFNSITVDGYFTGPKGDISWSKTDNDAEFNAFIEGNAKSGGVLLFGRVTYEMMVSYWPTPEAMKQNPVVAERMNSLPKIVFSKTLKNVSWNNTKVVSSDIASEVRKLKKESRQDLVLMGSGSIISQLAPEGLIDEYQFIVTPVALGDGRTMFEGINDKLPMKLTRSRTFGNGKIAVWYEPLPVRRSEENPELDLEAEEKTLVAMAQ